MPLGKVNFAAAKNAYPVIPVPTGETREVEAVTKSWEPVENSSGDGQHVLAKFSVSYEFESGPRTFDLSTRWAITNQNGLWRTQRDLIAMGADPDEFAQEETDVEAILNEMFAQPRKVTLVVKETTYTPKDHNPDDPTSPQPRQQNEIVAFKAYGS